MSPLTRALLALVAGGVLLVACAPATPAPTPTKAAQAPSDAASATAAKTATTMSPATSIPTAASPTATKATNFPAKDKVITIIVPYAPGGSGDIGSRVLAPLLEKELGVTVQIENKAGAGSQTGLTELVRSKPDGYTMSQCIFPTVPTLYLEESRKAIFTRKSFQTVAAYGRVPEGFVVESSSPFKAIKDVVDAALSKPNGVTMATAGLITSTHSSALRFQKAVGAEFAYVHFDGGAPELTAILGGHVDVGSVGLTTVLPQAKSGNIRVLSINEANRVKQPAFAEFSTLREQGYDVASSVYHGLVLPAGVPTEIVNILSAAMKKAADSPEAKAKLEEIGIVPDYLDPAQMSDMWQKQEAEVGEMLKMAK